MEKPKKIIQADVLDQARVLTILLCNVNPHISREATFDLMIRAMDEGMNDEEAAHYGYLIRQTMSSVTSNAAH